MKIIHWNAPEYTHTPKTAEWYFAFFIISVALIATAALLDNFLFAGVVALASLALLFYSNRAPEIISFSINQNGVQIGNLLYEYEELASFWIDESNINGARLLLRQKKLLSFLVSAPIENVHPNLVRSAIKDYLPEEELKEPFFQKFFEYLGF
jgi:hypothetical protein